MIVEENTPAEAAPVEEAAPEAAAQEEPSNLRDAIADSATRAMSEQSEAPAEEEAPPEETEEPAEEEAPAVEPEEQEAEEESTEAAYTPAQIKLALEVFDAGPSHEEYDIAVEILDELGLIETTEEQPVEETDEERRAREDREWIDQQKEKEAEAAKAAALAEKEAEFFSELDEHFAKEGEQFPRDPKQWSPEQKLQARLTANLENEGGAEAAKNLIKEFSKADRQAYIDSKEEPKSPAVTDRTAAEARGSDEQTPREGIAEAAVRVMQGASAQT